MIDNEQALLDALLQETKDILESVSDKLLDKLTGDGNNNLITDIVYSAGSPTWYERQGRDGGILGLFDKEVTAFGSAVESKITEFPDRLYHDPDIFIHGSFFWKGGDDIRDFLIDMIVRGTSGPLFGEGFWTEPRDFWQPFLDFTDKNLTRLINSEFRSRNISFKKI